MSFKDKGYIIFGANGSIGNAIANKLHEQSANIFLVGRDQDKISELASKYSCSCAIADVTIYQEVENAVELATEQFGDSLNGVVNAVGSVLLKPAHATSENEWMSVLHTNLTSSFYILKSSVKRLQKTGGALLFFSTAASLRGIANHEAIAAAKAGIDGMVRSAAATYASKNIRVNSIAPGLTDTKMTKRIVENKAALQMSLGMHALGRIGTVDDIVSGAMWLLDSNNSWISGQTIAIDGGLSKLYPTSR